jgi:hypothetical protein
MRVSRSFQRKEVKRKSAANIQEEGGKENSF